MKNTANEISSVDDLMVINVGVTYEQKKLLMNVDTTLRCIFTKGEECINKAFCTHTDKRGTIHLDFGFTMNKCTEFVPINALNDFHIPTHTSGVKSKLELSMIFMNINKLLLNFEALSMNNNKCFGVKQGKWFHDDNGSILSEYKYRFADDVGINSEHVDWRIYGCTIIFKADKLNLHMDTYNSVEDNYSMVVVFSTLVPQDIIPKSLLAYLSKKLDIVPTTILNMTVVIYGRKQLSSLLNKIDTRKKYVKENNLLKGFLNGVLKDNTWGYEAWLHHFGYEHIRRNISVLCDLKVANEVKSFVSSIYQNKCMQLKEKEYFYHTFCVLPAMMSKQLYWSSFSTIYYRLQLRFNLNEYEMFEVFLFLATEGNGQCLMWQIFVWHIMNMTEDALRLEIRNSGSLYSLLCSILVNTVNRHLNTNHGNSIVPRHQKMCDTAISNYGCVHKTNQRNRDLFRLFRSCAIKVHYAKNTKEIPNILTETREQLQTFPNFGYMTIDNLIQLGSMCGVLPAICYTIKALPKELSSGSNMYITKKVEIEKKDWKHKQKQFKELVNMVHNCSSKRIFESDIENGLCELSREERQCRKKECIFWDKHYDTIQNFFRIHKTNISKHNSVMKYQVQIFKNKKWINMDKLFVLMYELCSDEVRESFGKRSNNVKDILLCEEDIKQ